MPILKKINSCRICKKKKLKSVINLGKQYIQGSFVKKNYPLTYNKKIPLELVLCSNCNLLQAKYTVAPKILYKNYWYSSGVNSTMREHLKSLAKKSIKILQINNLKNANLNILDIGCNDGTFLNYFPKSIKKFGVDPSQIAKKLKEKM